MGAVTLVGVGAIVFGTTAATPGTVAGTATGDTALILAESKQPGVGVPAAPAGWLTLLDVTVNAGGTVGGNTGPMRLQAFAEQVDGSFAWPAVSNFSGTGQVIGVTPVVVRPASGESIELAATYGEDLDGGTAWSATGGSVLAIAAADLVIAWSCAADNGITVTGGTITAAGATFGTTTEDVDASTPNGDDMGAYVHHATVTSGTATGAPNLAMTLSVGIAGQSVGGTGFLRVRSKPGPPPVFPSQYGGFH